METSKMFEANQVKEKSSLSFNKTLLKYMAWIGFMALVVLILNIF